MCDGVYQGGGKTTQRLKKVLTAPENWVAPSHGLSLVGLRGYNWEGNVPVLYDSNGDGFITNNTSEISTLSASGNYIEGEMGGDGALYVTAGGALQRIQSSGSTTSFFTPGGGGNPVSAWSEGCGIAVGSGASSPVVYLCGMSASSHPTIFALKDGDGDKVVTPGNPNDTIAAIWTYGGFGLNVDYDSIYSLEDVEFYQNPASGTKFLVAHSYYNQVWVVELAADGMSAVAGKWIQSVDGGIGPGGYISGFELDMSPPPSRNGSVVLMR